MSLLVPVTLGMFVKHRWPKVAKKILKVSVDLQWFFFIALTFTHNCTDPLTENWYMYVFVYWCTVFIYVLLQFGSIVGVLLIIIIAVVGGVLYQSSWTISPSLWIIGALYPLVGFGLGFLLARFVGQPWYRYYSKSLYFFGSLFSDSFWATVKYYSKD